MTPEESRIRREAYERVLSIGLLAIRDVAARRGQADVCEVEADHLHNIPSLLDETNEHRHVYYAVHERGLYLARIRASADETYLDRTVKLYEEPWKVILGCAMRSQKEINKELEQQVRRVSSEGAPSDEPST
jgi:hypothetical protein